MNSIYTDVERAFLHDYFGSERPRSLINIDIYDDQRDGGVTLRDESNYPGVNLANAVARLALSRLEFLGRGWNSHESLPYLLSKGHTRDGYEGQYDIDLYPLYLFGVNWSLPPDSTILQEYYYLTWFPEFDRYVVTASVNNKDTYGVSDFAIGWDSASNKRIELCREIILRYWDDVHKPFNGFGWNEVTTTGLVPEDLALDWRAETWPVLISEARFRAVDSRDMGRGLFNYRP